MVYRILCTNSCLLSEACRRTNSGNHSIFHRNHPDIDIFAAEESEIRKRLDQIESKQWLFAGRGVHRPLQFTFNTVCTGTVSLQLPIFSCNPIEIMSSGLMNRTVPSHTK